LEDLRLLVAEETTVPHRLLRYEDVIIAHGRYRQG
jgi:hypothetical protein